MKKTVNKETAAVKENLLFTPECSENAMSGMETDDSTGFEDAFEKEINEVLRELEEED